MRYWHVCLEESQNPTLVLGWGEGVEVLMTCTHEFPELLGFRCCLEEPARFIGSGINVFLATYQEKRSGRCANSINRTEGAWGDASSKPQLGEQQRSEETARNIRTEMRSDPVGSSLLDRRVDRLDHERLEIHRGGTEDRGGTPEGCADCAYGLVWNCRPSEGARGSGVEALEGTKGLMRPDGFTVGLEIEEKNGIPGVQQEARTRKHGEAIRTNAMHQEDGSLATRTADEPASDLSARCAGKLHGFRVKAPGRRADLLLCGTGDLGADEHAGTAPQEHGPAEDAKSEPLAHDQALESRRTA